MDGRKVWMDTITAPTGTEDIHCALGYAAGGGSLSSSVLFRCTALLPHPHPCWQFMEIGSLVRSVGDLFGSNLTFWPVLPMVNKDGDRIVQREGRSPCRPKHSYLL
jgi:hypothetical protein